MNVFKFKPSRDQAANGCLVFDLDALIQKPVAFRFNGKIHYLKPVSTEVFFDVVNKLSGLTNISSTKTAGTKEVVDGYHGLFSAVCDTITRRDIEQMSISQTHALLSNIIQHIQGKTESSEKKNPTVETQEESQ